MLAKFFRVAFGALGDRTSIPDDLQPDGSVSFEEGFGADYQGDLLTDPNAKPIPRDQSNDLYYQITQALQILQTFGGAAEWIAPADNDGVSFEYAQYARVQYLGAVYESLIDSNTDVPTNYSTWWKVDIQILSAPIGTVFTGYYDGPPPGCINALGGTYNRVDYPRLWQQIVNAGLFISDATWLSDVSFQGYFSSGNGTTTFRAPALGGMFMRIADAGRGIDPGRTVASYQADAFKSHTHALHNAVSDSPGGVPTNVVGGNELQNLTVDSTGDTETRPKNVAFTAIIKAA